MNKEYENNTFENNSGHPFDEEETINSASRPEQAFPDSDAPAGQDNPPQAAEPSVSPQEYSQADASDPQLSQQEDFTDRSSGFPGSGQQPEQPHNEAEPLSGGFTDSPANGGDIYSDSNAQINAGASEAPYSDPTPSPSEQAADPSSLNYSSQGDASGYQYNQDYPYSASYGPHTNYQDPYFGYNNSYQVPPQGPAQPEQKTRKERKKSGMGLKIAAIALVCALAGGAVGGISTYALISNTKGSGSSLNSTNNVQNVKINDSYNSSVEAIADKVLPSVVGIKTTYRQSAGNSIFGFGGSQSSEASAEGSGVVYTEDGYIITNYHVVEEAATSGGTISVYLNENKDESFPATVIGYDAGADLAVIKIEKTGLTPIEMGDSSSLQVGQLAVAIGNPGGLDFMGSVSQGIVSGLNRTITLESGVSMELIQTDAAINPGNSGGALVDGTGKLIGINSAKLASEGFEGMGFAIPADDVKTITDRLINNQGKKAAYLGISIDSRYTADTLKQMGYPTGVVVASVVEGGPAETAGLKQGDIITTVAGKEIASYDILVSELAKYSPGEQIELEVFRLSQTQKVTVTLGETSSQQSSTSSR